jgi:hypothetical protein
MPAVAPEYFAVTKHWCPTRGVAELDSAGAIGHAKSVAPRRLSNSKCDGVGQGTGERLDHWLVVAKNGGLYLDTRLLSWRPVIYTNEHSPLGEWFARRESGKGEGLRTRWRAPNNSLPAPRRIP